jgi:protein ImuB
MFIVLQVADFPLQAALRASAAAAKPPSDPAAGDTAPLPFTSELAARLVATAPKPTRLQDTGLPSAMAADLATSLAAPPPADLYLTRPAALFSGTTKKSTALFVNAVARQAGVARGMSAPQAVARCSHLLIHAPHPPAESDAQALLLAAAFTVSPHIEDTAPGLVTLDASGLAPPTRAPASAAALARLAALGLHATAGVARTPLLALYAARTAQVERIDPIPLESSGRVPATVREITSASETTFLAPLPLATFEPDSTLANVLRSWGLRTGGDLTRLSRDEIGRRLGAAGVALWDRAHGGEPRPLHLVAPPQEFFAAQEFPESLETLEPLLFVLRRFLDRLSLELEAAHRVAVELDLTLTLENETTHPRSFRLPEPTRDAAILFRTLHTHLESLRTDSPIVAASLRVTPTRPLVRQPGLFETGLRDPHGFAETLARVMALLGPTRVGTPQPEDTNRPDAVRLVPPLAIIPPPAPAPAPAQPLLGRPLRRFRPPLPARIEIAAGRPTFLWTDRTQGAISSHRGPWSSSGDWWQADRTWRRLEWDIALANNGGLYRLVRTGDAWFLEGEYD